MIVLVINHYFYNIRSEAKRALFRPKNYWNGNSKLPVYNNPTERISTEDAANIILNDVQEDMLCEMQPTCEDKNTLFVVDLEKLRDPKDITCDDMGSWRLNGTHPSYVTKSHSGLISIISQKSVNKGKMKGDMYKMIKRYYYHKTARDLNKTIFLMQGNIMMCCITFCTLPQFVIFGPIDSDSQLLNRSIVQYHFTGNEHEILVRPHGNSKRSEPYVRTMPSTLNKLTEVASEKTPKPALHAVSSQSGGVISALSAGSLPRNERQVKNIRGKLKNVTGNSTDPLHSVMMMCKDTMKDFVRTVTGAPDYMVFVASDRTLDNLVRFCTTTKNSLQPCILTFDPTFSLGDFDVTVSTYKHPLIEFCNPKEHTSRHPNLLGPILIHQRKKFANYHYLTSTLVGYRPELRHLHAFGTDGEKALVQACHSQFPNAFHLRCWLHFKDNLLNKLERDLRLPRDIAHEFIADVMGNVSTMEHGLLDAKDEEVFTAQLSSLEEVWNKREHKYTNQDPVFYDWFLKHSKEVIINSMLYSVRRSAGLGNPPSPYYTNAVESINNLLKLRTNFKKQEVTTFIVKLKELVDNQFAEVDRAVAGIGDYEVSKDCPKFRFTSASWFSMSEDQRQRILMRFQSLLPSVSLQKEHHSPKDTSPFSQATVQSQDTGSTSQEPSKLSTDADGQEDANLIAGLAIPQYIADTIWKHATSLLQKDSNFASAPGNNGQAWLVARSSSSNAGRPYFVHIHKGHYECESDCIYYQTCKVCQHIVAIAIRSGDLSKFLTWHKKQNHHVNTTHLAQSGLPLSSVGKKKAPRKGISKQKSAKIRKICAEADESSWQLRPALGNVSTTGTTSTPSQIATPVTVQPAASLSQISSPASQLVSPQVSSIFPAPSAPFKLILLHGNIAVCSGCHQRFPRKPSGDYADPPYNMAIQHVEQRMFNSPITGMPTSRVGNAYYHVYLPCLRSNWPTLSGNDIIIPTELLPMLQPEHKIFLFQNLGIRV